MTYTNDGLPLLINCQITEYDIESGNTSMMRHYQLVDEDTINHLERMPKEERVISVGLLQRNNREFAKMLEASFNKSVDQFLAQNDLDKDVDVLSIRKDAVFVVNKPVNHPNIGKHIHFRPKHIYHAAILLNRWHFFFEKNKPVKVDFFINEEKDPNRAIPKLREGIMDFLREFVEVCESSNMNRSLIYPWLKDFCTAYKEKRLDLEYYREFTPDALFHINDGDGSTYMEDVPDYLIEDLDISFNYRNIIVPLCQILI